MRIPLLAFSVAALSLAAARPFTLEDHFKVQRVTDPQMSSKNDLAYQVATHDPVANKTTTKIWIKQAGQAAQALNLGDGSQSRPRFSPDGSKLAYQSGGQIWVMDLQSQEKKQITKLSGGASDAQWSPDGAMLAFLSTTVPSGVDSENAAYLKAKGEKPSSGMVYDTLMYRHYNAWRDAQQVSHLFVVKLDGGEPKDITAGWKHDVPNAAGTDAGDGFSWSPDASRIAFSSHPEFEKGHSTNGEVYEVELSGGNPRKITDNPAMDNTPRYSPCGKYLSWRAQARPGFEADKWELRVMDRQSGKIISTTAKHDIRVESYTWQGNNAVFSTPDKGYKTLFSWNGQGAPKRLCEKLYVENFVLTQDGKKALAQLTSFTMPPDIFEIDLANGKSTRVTDHNKALMEEMALNPGEALYVKGGAGKDGKAPMVHSWIVKPVNFDPNKKYPVAFLIHGGPQGYWGDQWHFRWNAQAWAGRGFIAVLPNPRGSEGWGQQFEDEISGDWSGRVMKDLMNSLDGALKACPNADPKRVMACGASYGGYAVNWIAGHYADRFAGFVCHAGIFNTSAMQLATEEFWFPRWEFKGYPWDSESTRALWEKHSPHHAYKKFKKPMMVMHGVQDFRVVYTEALQSYNVHQLRGIPSRLVIFPDEAHTILKPANAKLWHEEVLNWCEKWTK